MEQGIHDIGQELVQRLQDFRTRLISESLEKHHKLDPSKKETWERVTQLTPDVVSVNEYTEMYYLDCDDIKHMDDLKPENCICHITHKMNDLFSEKFGFGITFMTPVKDSIFKKK